MDLSIGFLPGQYKISMRNEYLCKTGFSTIGGQSLPIQSIDFSSMDKFSDCMIYTSVGTNNIILNSNSAVYTQVTYGYGQDIIKNFDSKALYVLPKELVNSTKELYNHIEVNHYADESHIKIFGINPSNEDFDISITTIGHMSVDDFIKNVYCSVFSTVISATIKYVDYS